MKIRIHGAGWYGCSIAHGMLHRGHDVDILETAGIFAGASGANPARLHLGFHYPRSRLTRAFCQEHQSAFLVRYGHFTRAVPTNLYAVAEHDSLVDFGTYCQILQGEVEYISVYNPREFGLHHVEGAVLTGERHIVIRGVKEFFSANLGRHLNSASWDADWEIDCTFCARDSENIDRYEACLTVLLEGPTDKAVTIMDGPFPSIYPWDEEQNMNSLTSAKFTPIKRCQTYEEARHVLDHLDKDEVAGRATAMLEQIAFYWPEARDFYRIADYRFGVRAMPKSAADARLVDIVRTGERSLRVRAGKIDAVIHAEKLICGIIEDGSNAG